MAVTAYLPMAMFACIAAVAVRGLLLVWQITRERFRSDNIDTPLKRSLTRPRLAIITAHMGFCFSAARAQGRQRSPQRCELVNRLTRYPASGLLPAAAGL